MDVPLANTSKPEHMTLTKEACICMIKLYSHGDKLEQKGW